MGDCYRAYDREPEPAAASSTGFVGPAEAVKCACGELRGKSRPIVCDVELGVAFVVLGSEPDHPGAVKERVIYEVAERLLYALGIAFEGHVTRNSDDDVASILSCAHRKPLGHGREQMTGRDYLRVDGYCRFFRAGDQEKVGGERGQSVGFFCSRAERGFELCAGARFAEREVKFGA